MTLICVHASQSGRGLGVSDLERPCFLYSAPLSLSVSVINSHWVMDDQRVQEWDGFLPEPPIPSCFVHLVYISAWTVHSERDPFHQQPVQVSLASVLTN